MTNSLVSLQSMKKLWLRLLGTSLISIAGCGESGTTVPDNTISDLPPDTGVHDEHSHASEGPHHGDLVELGNEEYHAEIVHSEAGSVTVYILDSTAKTAVPIEATELMINISHDGKAEQFKLAAERDASDPEGKSSRFSLKDEELASDLDSHDAAAKLVVMIDGKSFSGRIEHQHEGEHQHDDGHKH
jgi:ABC-type oligopeptide transport system substrate-binding subunit